MSDAPGWVTLTEGETVVWRGNPVVYHYLHGFLLALALFGVAAAVAVFWPFASVATGWIPAAIVVAVGVLVALRTLLAWRSVQYVVTTEEVYVRRGLVSRTVTNLRMDRIQNTSFTQSLGGRLFSYGDVEIDTAGSEGTEVVLRNVGDPEDVLGYISEWMGKEEAVATG